MPDFGQSFGPSAPCQHDGHCSRVHAHDFVILPHLTLLPKCELAHHQPSLPPSSSPAFPLSFRSSITLLTLSASEYTIRTVGRPAILAGDPFAPQKELKDCKEVGINQKNCSMIVKYVGVDIIKAHLVQDALVVRSRNASVRVGKVSVRVNDQEAWCSWAT